MAQSFRLLQQPQWLPMWPQATIYVYIYGYLNNLSPNVRDTLIDLTRCSQQDCFAKVEQAFRLSQQRPNRCQRGHKKKCTVAL